MDNISLIPKDEVGNSGLPKFVSFKKPDIEISALAKVGLILILVLLLVSAGFYFWKYQLNKQAESFNAELQNLTSQRDLSLENRLKNLNSVTFKSLEAGDSDNVIALSGLAPSYGVLAQQVKIFEDTPHIVSVNSSNIGLSAEGQVGFNLKIVFSKELITKK